MVDSKTYSRKLVEYPFFSICIPQYNRTSFLLKLLRSLSEQNFDSFEVCISDDRSPDGRQDEVADFLEESGLSYIYKIQQENCGYDENMRGAIELARGRYCFFMSNDDALAGAGALKDLKASIEAHGSAGVIITDYEGYDTNERAYRVRETQNYGSGPKVAAEHFRDFSYVGGVLLDRAQAQERSTDKWDGSEMYQTLIGCQIIASGRSLLELSDVPVQKDISLPEEEVDSYAKRNPDSTIKERRIPLSQLGRVVSDAISPYTNSGQQRRLNEKILRQLLCFTYPFWLVEYRRVHSWKYALGVALGMRPDILAQGMDLNPVQRGRVNLLYLTATVAGLIFPITAFDRLKPLFYRIAKTYF